MSRTSLAFGIVALLVLSSSALAWPTLDVSETNVDTGAVDTGLVVVDTGGDGGDNWDTGETGDSADSGGDTGDDSGVEWEDPFADGELPDGSGGGPVVELPRRGCKRLDLKMSAIDADYYIRDLLGYKFIKQDGTEDREFGWIETIDVHTWSVQHNTKNKPDLTELRAAVELAMEETRKAKSAIGPWQDNDEDELKQQIVDTECHLVAARHALQQAKALYDALPADLRKTEGLQSGFRIIDDSFVGAFANLDYIAAVLKMQREACQQP